MKELTHFKFFKSLLEEQENDLVKEAIKQGRIPVGYTCSYVPTPALMVDKLFPIRLRANNVEDTEYASYLLSALLCTYSRSILQATIDGEYNFIKAMVGTTACGHMCGAVENADWKKIIEDKDTIYPVIDIPKSKGFAPAIEANITQYKQKLYEPLDKLYGLDYSDTAIKEAIDRYNEFTAIIREISDLRKLENPKITGLEFHIIYTACQVVPVDMIMDKLEETLKELKAREGISNYKAKVMVLGSSLDNPIYTKLIEDQGAIVVVDRYCTGSMPGIKPIKVGKTPLFDLLNFWMDERMCPKVINDTFGRENYNKKLFKEFNAEGVIYQRMKFCEYWAYEGVTMQEVFKEANIPYVSIEREYNLASEGQLRTRIQAFIESLDIKRINKKL